MMSSSSQPMEFSARILDSYLAGLRAEVARLILMRENSKDLMWLAQLDLQIKLKMQVIEDVSGCLATDEEEEFDEPEVEIEYDSLPGICSVLPSNS